MKTYCFIDASNIIYGTRDDGWKVDFDKLFQYLKNRYECDKVYYFAGIDKKNIKQQNFYKVLGKIGYDLILKKVKIYVQPGGSSVRKANCDVDLTFYAMRDLEKYDRSIFLTGDGDFEVLFKYILKIRKKVIVLGNAKRTAKEIKVIKGLQFNDLKVLKSIIERPVKIEVLK